MFTTIASSGYKMIATRNPDDVRSAQFLRYIVFNVELGEGLDSSDEIGLDVDPFDDQCDHLIIEDLNSGNIIGTYRLQTGAMAAAGIGYYSANEFDFTPYEPMRQQVLELGRACIHADHRNRAVLDLLWSGIIRYALSKKSRYLLGCSSLTSQNATEGWGLYEQLKGKYLAPAHLQTQPIGSFVMPKPTKLKENVKCPKLFASYLTIGAWFAGPPALDKDFKTIDFLTLLDLENMTRAARKHYFKKVD